MVRANRKLTNDNHPLEGKEQEHLLCLIGEYYKAACHELPQYHKIPAKSRRAQKTVSKSHQRKQSRETNSFSFQHIVKKQGGLLLKNKTNISKISWYRRCLGLNQIVSDGNGFFYYFPYIIHW